MKDTLRRMATQQTQAKPTAPAKPAAQVAAPAAQASREWAKPDAGHEYRHPAPAAPAPKQSGLDKRMVALLAQQAKPTYR